MSRKKKNTTVSVKLTRWQKRLADSNAAYSAEVQKMDERERIYNGENTLRPLVPGDTKRTDSRKRPATSATSCLRISRARFPPPFRRPR